MSATGGGEKAGAGGGGAELPSPHFSDLCAKDNGLNSQRVNKYTYLKVTIAMC
jgi:hypothetical protein